MQASGEVAGVFTSTSVQLFVTMSVTERAIAPQSLSTLDGHFHTPFIMFPSDANEACITHHELLPCVGKPRPACLALSPCAVSDRASGTHSR